MIDTRRFAAAWLWAALLGCSRRETPNHAPIEPVDETEVAKPSAVPSALPPPAPSASMSATPEDDGKPKPVTLTWVLYDQTTDQQKTMIEAVVRFSPTKVQRQVLGTLDYGTCEIPEPLREPKNPIPVGSLVSAVTCRYGSDLTSASARRTAPDELTLEWALASATELEGQPPTPPKLISRIKIPTGAIFTIKRIDLAKK